ncbi:TFIIS N-terminal domain-containing protein [Aphelenchoides besseyi]|nr:TFIIS N-terminal domain-containing protein [Aphelenchoides besseyi]KAI6193551.1 TFIIS N-terminal domain-containing protein [Aphelenchoides besseyi]
MHCFAQRPVSPLPARPTVASHELSNDGLFAVSVRQAEQLKSQLTQAVDNGQMADVARIIVEIEAANLTKEALEVSRIAAIVNALRKKIAESHPSISRKCRALIKLWQLTVDAARSTSSAGSSSCNGTPSLISPALRRGATPRGKTVTPNGNPLLNGIGGNSSYAPSNISPQLAATKRKHTSSSNASPDVVGVAAKKSKQSPSNISPPAAVTNSVIAARRNVQSTEQLVAALGMENLLAKSIEKKATETTNQMNGTNKVLPIQVPTIDNEPTASRRKRQPKTEAASTQMPRIKIVFGKRASGEMETKIEEVKPEQITPSPDATKSETSSDETSATDGSGATNNATAPKKQKPAFSWYDKLPSIEELEKRIRDPPSVITERPSSPTDMMKCKFRDRSLILMPYIDSDEPDFVTYDFPTPAAVAPTPKA